MTKGKFLIFFFLVIISFFWQSCSKEKVSGDGAVVSLQRDVKNFYNIHVYGNTTLEIEGGTTFKVEVKGFENLVPHLQTKVEDGTLYVRFDDKVAVSNDNTEVHVILPSLLSLISEGSGEINVTGPFVNMDVFSVEKSGTGDIQVLKTTANSFKLLINGNSNFRGFDLNCQNAVITVNGDGNTEINVSKILNATIRGNGIIYYKGNPEVTTVIDGGGQVIKK